ncbi:MAG: ribosome biogenesis GTPase Der [Caldisericia bacterium]|jgi:GTP-binding protein|nr:ribosome biogenesis GTPase Der [Caldisericia bacterium]
MFKIAIVGRPNTGKSTLFNTLIKKSKAVTYELPGTTRDYIYGEGFINGKKVSFLDTGGISFDEKTELSEKIRMQVEIAIETSNLVIFLIDGSIKTVTDEDRKIAKMLHKKNKEVILVLNKCDLNGACEESYIYLELGFGEPLKISATKKIGIDILIEKINEKIKIDYKEDRLIETKLPKISIIGKPNVGKSTLLNAISNFERAITSSEPGTTRDIIEHLISYNGKDYIFLDTPGVRKGILKDLDFYVSLRAIKAIKESDIVLFVISCEDVSRTDEHLMSLILKNKKSGILVMNKLDLINPKKLDQYLNEVAYRLNEILFYPQVMISALKKENLNLIFKLIDIVFNNIKKELSQIQIKDIIFDLITKHPPPRKGKKLLKIYDVMVDNNNIKEITLTVNDKDFLKKDYLRYLVDRIRDKFDLEGVFIDFIIKEKRKEKRK